MNPTINSDIEPMMKVEDLAVMLRRTPRTVRYWRAQGLLPEPDLAIARTCLWKRETIDRWLDTKPQIG